MVDDVEDTGVTVIQRDRFAGVERRDDERRLVPRLALIVRPADEQLGVLGRLVVPGRRSGLAVEGEQLVIGDDGPRPVEAGVDVEDLERLAEGRATVFGHGHEGPGERPGSSPPCERRHMT